jgi:hypothetical protein
MPFVNTLQPITGDAAQRIKLAAGISPTLVVPAAAAAMPPKMVTKPGVERWPVKTGTDADAAEVGKEQKPDGTFDFGFVATTVEELISIARPAAAEQPTAQDHRIAAAETTVWQIEAEVIALKQEADGDYHLVLQGDSGDTMIGEIPTPRAPFVGAGSPFLSDITDARKWADTNLLSKAPALARVGTTLSPPAAMTMAPAAPTAPGANSIAPAAAGAASPTFKTKIRAAKVRITGVGFFDFLHGQTGVAANGIELHPVLAIEFV